MKRFFLVFLFLMVAVSCFAEPYELPAGSKTWAGWKSDFNKIFKYFGATAGEPEAEPTIIGPLNVIGDGDSWFAIPNNTTITDPITGLYIYTFLGGNPTVALNGTLKRLALFEELAAGDTSVIQADDPTLASATGKYYSRASGDYFNVVHGIEMFAIAGTRTADETAPVIVVGADSTHDGSTPVTATMALTELYPDPSTLLYTVTGGTPASGTWAGTYPNYSFEVTPTGTDPIIVTSSASDLAGNVATGTRLTQTFTHSAGSAKDANSVLYYTCDNVGGDTVAETYASNTTGTLTTSTISALQNNTAGGANSLLGSGTADTVSFISFSRADSGFLSASGFLTTYIYPTGTGDDNQFFGADTDASNYIRGWVETDRTVKLYFYGGSLSALTSGDTVTLNTWNKVDLRWNTTSNRISIRINGGSWIDKTDVDISTFTSAPTTITFGNSRSTNASIGYVDDCELWRTDDQTY